MQTKKTSTAKKAQTTKTALVPQSITLKKGKVIKTEPAQAIEKVLITKASEKNAIARPTTIKDKNFLYRYQLDAATKALGEKAHKKLRSKLRRDLQLLINKLILSNAKKADYTECPAFIAFYKNHYILNDFSLKSITNSGDELKQQDLIKCLNICQAFLAKK